MASIFDPQAKRHQRAVVLAGERHLSYTARLICEGLRRDLYEVPSVDRRGVHIVSRRHADNEYGCDCRSGQFDRICAHIGAAIILDMYRLPQHPATPARAA